MNPLNHPGAHVAPKNDLEKQEELKDTAVNVSPLDSEAAESPTPGHVQPQNTFAKWSARVEGLSGLEARGISRVLPEEKHGGGAAGYFQIFALWFGLSLCVVNTIVGFLGPLVFALGWVDSVCIVVFAIALAACGPAYIATFGPESGHRTMVSISVG